MRVVAWLLIILSLVVTVVSAVTAYLPQLSLADERLRRHDGEPLTLGAAVGKPTTDGKSTPIASAGEKLTPQLIAQLRAADLKRVRVKEFSISRWSEWWIFALGSLGMLSGAMLMRLASAHELKAAEGAASPGKGPESALQQLRQELAELRRQISATNDGQERLRLIDQHVDSMVSQHVAPFIAARPVLVSRLGLAGYAQLMDHFAAGERQLNRAWSAAADGYEQEAVECLDRAAVLLDEAQQKMS